jgi:hypothetical protein
MTGWHMVYSLSDNRRSLGAARNADGLEIFGSMNAINESWSCPGCGVRFASTAPEHRLCRDCVGQLESLGYEPAPGAPYGYLPPCLDGGGPMVEVVAMLEPPDPEPDGGRRE